MNANPAPANYTMTRRIRLPGATTAGRALAGPFRHGAVAEPTPGTGPTRVAKSRPATFAILATSLSNWIHTVLQSAQYPEGCASAQPWLLHDLRTALSCASLPVELPLLRGQPDSRNPEAQSTAPRQSLLGAQQASSCDSRSGRRRRAETTPAGLAALKTVARCWGWEKVRHYGWPTRGDRYNDSLRAVAKAVENWAEFTIKANQLLLRYFHLSATSRRCKLPDAVDPLQHTVLENAKKWSHGDSFVMDNDPDKVPLLLKKLSNRDLPPGFGFDRNGLMVREKYAARDSDFDTNVIETLDQVPSDAGDDSKRFHDVASSLISPTGTTDASSSSQLSSASGEQGDISSRDEAAASWRAVAATGPASEAGPRDDGGDDSGSVANGVAGPGRMLRSRVKPTEPGTNSKDKTAGTVRDTDDQNPATRQTRSTRNHDVNYHEPPSRQVPARHPAQPLNLVGPGQDRCCPTKVPADLLRILDNPLFSSRSFTLPADLIGPYIGYLPLLCYSHVQKFCTVLLELIPAETVESNSKPNSGLVLDEHSKAKRRASLPDITADLKRPRLDELVSPTAATSQGGRPQHDPIRDEDYRKQVLAELKLGRSRPPATDGPDNPEAHFWTGDQAAVGVGLGSVHIPIITKGQQRFRWSDGRPVVQLFRRMEDLDRHVAVQIPSRSSEKDSFQTRCLRDVEKRFLDGQPTDDPWNLLDLASPMPPSILPSFLEGENCQLLPEIRSEQTLGLGGHILQWTSIRSWLEVVADQMRNPRTTNEDMGPSAKKYINIVLELIAKKVKNGRLEDIGGQVEVTEIVALVKEMRKEFPVSPARELFQSMLDKTTATEHVELHGPMPAQKLNNASVEDDAFGTDRIVLASQFNSNAILSDMLDEYEPSQATKNRSLYWAARLGHDKIVASLLRAGADPNSRELERQTALTAACEHGNSLCWTWSGREGALSFACGGGYDDIVQELLKRPGCKGDSPDRSGATPFFWAVGGGHHSTVRILARRHGVKINHQDKLGRTAISWAAGDGMADILMTLLALPGIGVNILDKKGRSPLSWASGNGQINTVQVLLEATAVDKASIDSDKRTAISWASAGGHYAVLLLLLDKGCPGVAMEDIDGWTPLAWAIQADSADTVQALLDSKKVQLEGTTVLDGPHCHGLSNTGI
ncbi:hypothetical protein ACCO45_012322 [Purpureocillium lilacinum]|uniref:Uncharacterized protein n=1 Tax=Purpureocillium lilacinum TaxID=33203 RepID=A0ACC4D9S5_PURLI